MQFKGVKDKKKKIKAKIRDNIKNNHKKGNNI